VGLIGCIHAGFLHLRSATGGKGHLPGRQKTGGRGNWSVVRSRKRKATKLEQSGRDGSRGSDGQRGMATGKGQGQQQVFDRVSKVSYQDRRVEGIMVTDRISNNMGARVATAE